MAIYFAGKIGKFSSSVVDSW